MVKAAGASSVAEVPPAVLPGTPQDFSLPQEELLALAKKLFAQDTGLQDPSALSDDFRFEFPIVSLPKEDFLKAVGSFNLKGAFPDMNAHPYDWRVDPYEPNRVWFTVRNTATHTGPLTFGRSTYPATGRIVQGAPECCSYTFNAEGKCTSFTGGYIMDRRVGNTKKLGAVFGILAAIGAPVPDPSSIRFNLLVKMNNLMQAIRGMYRAISGSKQKTT